MTKVIDNIIIITTNQQNNKTTKQQNNKTTKQQNNKTTKQQQQNKNQKYHTSIWYFFLGYNCYIL